MREKVQKSEATGRRQSKLMRRMHREMMRVIDMMNQAQEQLHEMNLVSRKRWQVSEEL